MKKLIPNVLLLLALTSTAYPQNYSIDWYKIAGGGGTSSGGGYTVSSTIGQPVAGGAMGGSYSVTSGFWSAFAVQTPGAPTLRIFLTTTNAAVVAWPAPSAGYMLQTIRDLATTNWTSVTIATNLVGSENQVIISPPSGNSYFRLKSP